MSTAHPRAPRVLPTLAGLGAVIALASGCLESTVPEITLPWNPEGRWVGEASGVLNGQAFAGDLELILLRGSAAATPGSPVVRINLSGSWAWGTENGPVTGYWLANRDEDAKNSGACPATQAACSVVLRLTPQILDDVCTEGPIVGQTYPIFFRGWFGGADTMVAGGLEGTFFELQFAPPPCTGSVVVRFDGPVELARADS